MVEETVWDATYDAQPNVEEAQWEEQEPQEDEQEDISVDTFGLLSLGHLTDTLDIFGHKVNIRTLKVGEELECELLVHKYKDTSEANRAYATALVAACIRSVDGQPLVQGLGPAEESLERRFHYVSTNWHWITVEMIYIGYRSLVERLMTSLEETKKDSTPVI